MSTTKITPAPPKRKEVVTTEHTAEPVSSNAGQSLPSKRISALASADVSKFVVNSINVTADTTAAYVNELNLVEEAESLSEARDRVMSTAAASERLKRASAAASRGNSTEIIISLAELQTILFSLEDYQKIKVEHEKLSTQNKSEVSVETKLMERMKRVLLQTMDKKAIVSMVMAFGCNPETRRRRDGHHKSSLGGVGTCITTEVEHAAESDQAMKEAIKLFPSDPEAMKRGRALLADADKWSKFDIWQFREVFHDDNKTTASALASYIFEDSLNLLTVNDVNKKTFKCWVRAVCDTYNAVPYHSALHGADVLQGLHSILGNSSLKTALSPTLMFSALTAAFVHDIGHPGRNNKFLMDSDHEIAIRYNDRSILENFHIATALSLSQRSDCNIFATMEPTNIKTVRTIWIDMILDTDMSRHFTVVQELESKLKKAVDEKKTYNAADKENHSFTLSILLHVCDLGNPTKKWNIYQKWTTRVMEEFHSQAESEVEAGRKPTMPLPLPSFKLGKFQQGFLRFIRSFFVSTNIINGINLSELINNLDENLKSWELKDLEDEKEEKKEKEEEERKKKEEKEKEKEEKEKD